MVMLPCFAVEESCLLPYYFASKVDPPSPPPPQLDAQNGGGFRGCVAFVPNHYLSSRPRESSHRAGTPVWYRAQPGSSAYGMLSLHRLLQFQFHDYCKG